MEPSKVNSKVFSDDLIQKVVELYKTTNSCIQVRKSLDVKLQAYEIYDILRNKGFELNQSRKKALKENNRNKTCKVCGVKYFDTTKRFIGITCSKTCVTQLMLEK